MVVLRRPCARRVWQLQTRRRVGWLQRASLPNTSMLDPGHPNLSFACAVLLCPCCCPLLLPLHFILDATLLSCLLIFLNIATAQLHVLNAKQGHVSTFGIMHLYMSVIKAPAVPVQGAKQYPLSVQLMHGGGGALAFDMPVRSACCAHVVH